MMRSIRVTNADVRRVWNDPDVKLEDAATALDLSVDALRARAKMLCLDARKTGRREVIRAADEPLFAALWVAGVSARQIGGAFGCSYFAVVSTAARLRLAPRGAGFRPSITLAEYRDQLVGGAMTRLAAAENAALQGLRA